MSPQSELTLPGAQSSIPLFSGASYEGTYIVGFVWGIVLHTAMSIMSITFDIFQWLMVTLVAGLLLHVFAVFLKRQRFRNAVSDQALMALFENVKRDLGKGEGIELWYRNTDRGVFLSTANHLFKAILLSESTIADILEKEDKGRILLAKEIMLIERLSPLSRVAIALLAFIFISFVEGLSFAGIWSYISFSLGPVVLVLGIIIVLIAVATIPNIQTRSVSKIDQVVEDLYGYPPTVATMEVLSGLTAPDEMIEKTRRTEEERPSGRRSSLKKGAAGAIVASFAIFAIMFLFLSNHPLFLTFALVMSAVVGVVVFAIIFAISTMWFLIKPSRQRSTEYDIQIPFATDVQAFLNRFLNGRRIPVIAISFPHSEEFGLVASRLKDSLEEEALFSIMPNVLRDINDVELAGPFILSEIWRKDIEKRYTRVNYDLVGFAIVFLFGSMLLSLALLGFDGFFLVMGRIFFIYLIVGLIPTTLLAYWKYKTEIKSDTKVVKHCPRFTEALQILVDKHHTLPYDTTSYKTRLERIARFLEPADERRINESSQNRDW
ncbi:MAG: hypothetical protein EAX81_08565 [Candidatus Thorarchaeota archaeon]|nr:hypothetical protein [Candidatus Thorarchaeota archaeon]